MLWTSHGIRNDGIRARELEQQVCNEQRVFAFVVGVIVQLGEYTEAAEMVGWTAVLLAIVANGSSCHDDDNDNDDMVVGGDADQHDDEHDDNDDDDDIDC